LGQILSDGDLSSLRFEVEAVRDSLTSLQHYDVAVVRPGSEEGGEEGEPFFFPRFFDGTYIVAKGDIANNPMNIAYSDDDGETWTLNTNSIGFFPSYMVTGLGLIVAAPNHWFGVASSVSGTWTSDTVGSDYINHLIFDGSQFVAARNDKLLTSTDGETWTDVTHDLLGLGVFKRIHKFGSNYFAVFELTSGVTKVYKASALTAWTVSYNNDVVDEGILRTVSDTNGVLFAMGTQKLSFRWRPFLLSSTDDGATWVDVSPEATTTNSASMSVSGIKYFDSKYVIFAGVDFEAFSSDLVTWTTDEPGLGYLYSGENAVVVGTKLITVRYYSGTNTELVFTEDGETWTVVTP
jgi:hypothetical protein